MTGGGIDSIPADSVTTAGPLAALCLTTRLAPAFPAPEASKPTSSEHRALGASCSGQLLTSENRVSPVMLGGRSNNAALPTLVIVTRCGLTAAPRLKTP